MPASAKSKSPAKAAAPKAAKTADKAAVTAVPGARPVKKGDHVFLVDGSGYIFRAYHAIRFEPRTPEGVHVNAVYGFWLVQVVFFLATWALFHHMLGGIRHFIWDSGNLLDPAGRETITRIQFALSIVLTLGAWALFVWFK